MLIVLYDDDKVKLLFLPKHFSNEKVFNDGRSHHDDCSKC